MPGIGLPKSGDGPRKADTQASTWYITGPPTKGAITAPTYIRGVIYLLPFEVNLAMTPSRLYIGSNTTAANRLKAAIYYDNGDTPAGGAKVPNSPIVPNTMLENKPTSGSFSGLTLLPGRYWLAITASTNQVAYYGAGPYQFLQTTVATASFRAGSLASNLQNVALPDPCPAVTKDVALTQMFSIKASR